MDELYYRLYLNAKNEPCIITLQYGMEYEENDYSKERWLDNKRYESMEAAIDAVAPWRMAWLQGRP